MIIVHRSGCAGEVSASSVVLLPHAPSSVRVARRRLGAELRAHAVPESAVSDAILVLSELLSNAVRHARPLPGGQVQVSWSLHDGMADSGAVGSGAVDRRTVEIAVSDGGSATRPHQLRPSVSALGGRGLAIVEHVAGQWGVRGDDQQTTVWAVLSAAPANGSVQRRPRRSPARAQARP